MHCMIHMMHVAAHDGARPPCKCKGPAIRCTSCYCCHHQPIQPCTCTAAHIPNSPTTTPPTATPVGCCPHHHSHTQPAATISAATFAASMFTAATSAAALINPQQSRTCATPPPTPSNTAATARTSFCAALLPSDVQDRRNCDVAEWREHLQRCVGGGATVGVSYLCGPLAVVGEKRGKPGGGGRCAPKKPAALITRGGLRPTGQLRGCGSSNSGTCVVVRHEFI